jgi:hypothetical protein
MNTAGYVAVIAQILYHAQTRDGIVALHEAGSRTALGCLRVCNSAGPRAIQIIQRIRIRHWEATALGADQHVLLCPIHVECMSTRGLSSPDRCLLECCYDGIGLRNCRAGKERSRW